MKNASPKLTGLRPFRAPLSDRLLRAHNFFELYPLDGGGALSFHSIMGEPDDVTLTRAILREGLLREWGDFPALDYAALDRWRSVEKSCWLNRFYFIVSMARAYAISGDESIAAAVRDAMLYFIRNYPPPRGRAAIGAHIREVYRIRDEDYNRRTFEENQADETDIRYIWFDFQPAARLLHMIHALRFLRGSSAISRANRKEIVESIHAHAEVVRTGEQYFEPLKPGNHQSFRGISLLTAAAFFHGTGAWRAFLRQGLRICNFHIRRDFHPDGCLDSHSPSYHCFETWHLRDAVALAAAYGFPLRADAPARLARAAAFLRAVEQPDGASPVINDGYPVRLAPFLKTLPGGERRAEPEAGRFKNAGIAFFRDGDRHLLFDVSPFTGQFSHYHAGKNAVALWVRGRPFLVDSGCPNYEDPWFATWYKTSAAHSSLLIDGEGDGVIVGTYNWDRWASTRLGTWRQTRAGHAVEGVLHSTSSAWTGVEWRRRVVMHDDGMVELRDRIVSDRTVQCELIFNLHPDVKATRRTRAVLLRNGPAQASCSWNGAEAQVELSRGRCYEMGRHRPNRRLRLRFTGEGDTELVTRLNIQ